MKNFERYAINKNNQDILRGGDLAETATDMAMGVITATPAGALLAFGITLIASAMYNSHRRANITGGASMPEDMTNVDLT